MNQEPQAVTIPDGIPTDARPVPNFSGYFVTPGGDVWTIEAGQPTTLQKHRDKKGRASVIMWDDQGFFRCIKCSVIVLLAFVGPRPRGQMSFHWRGKANDDRLENLKWATPQEIHDASRRRVAALGLRGERHSQARLTDADVAEIRKLRTEGATPAELAARFKVTRPYIHNICSGRARKRETPNQADESARQAG
jgi:hypothetical protein